MLLISRIFLPWVVWWRFGVLILFSVCVGLGFGSFAIFLNLVFRGGLGFGWFVLGMDIWVCIR